MRLAKAWFDQVVDHVGQTKDQVGQGQGQELDNNIMDMDCTENEKNIKTCIFAFALQPNLSKPCTCNINPVDNFEKVR